MIIEKCKVCGDTDGMPCTLDECSFRSKTEPAPVEQAGTNVGHGHVFPRADGVKMRCGGPGLCSECAADASRARAALAQPSPTLPPFAEKVLAKLRRFYDCAEDFESGGVDIGRHWLDLLTQLGLLNRVQRSPALWEISQQGEDLLGTPHPSPAQAEKAEAERQEVVDFNPYRYHAEKIRQRADGAASAYEAGHSALGYMEDIAESALIVRNGLDELSAQHERIVVAEKGKTAAAMLESHRQFVRQFEEGTVELITQRDAALAKLAELEKQKEFGLVIVSMKGGYKCFEFDEYSHAHSFPEGEHQLYAAPVAQAQHCVPERWRDMLAELQWHYEPYDDHHHTPQGFYCPRCGREQDEGHKPGCKIAELLAAAPGKDGDA